MEYDAAALRNRRILVVEDDYAIAEDIRRELEEVGATVLGPVPTVERALRLLENEPVVDAGLLDVNLGDEKSFAVARALEERSVPYLFATGYNSEDIPSEWRHAAIATKPLQCAAVVRLLAADEAARAAP